MLEILLRQVKRNQTKKIADEKLNKEQKMNIKNKKIVDTILKIIKNNIQMLIGKEFVEKIKKEYVNKKQN